jgi:hypothetical protein
MTRTLNQIQQSFISNLILNNSPLTDFSPSSVNTTLIRSIAALQLEQDILLNDLNINIDLSKSPGIYLDNKVNDFGIVRKPATYATGSVLIKNTLGLSNNSVLTDLNTNNQYIIVSSNYILNKFGEASYLIKSTFPGSKYNLPANSKLTFLDNPDVSIIVGTTRLDNLEVVGGLTTGSDKESDADLLNRFLYTILDKRFSTTNALKSVLLNQSNITFVSIDNPFPGHITIWFESNVVFLNSDIINLKEIIQAELPLGITFDLLMIQREYVSINLLITLTTKSRDDVVNKLTLDIKDWFSNLNVNEPFDPQVLLNYLNSVNFSFIPPVTYRDNPTIITPASDHLISLGNLLFTFNNV